VMSASACRVIVSDLGKVLLPFDFAPAKRWLGERTRFGADGEGAWRAASAIYEATGFAVGRCSAADFIERLRGELDLRATDEEFSGGWSDVFWTDEATVGLVASARAQQRVLLSNTDPIHWDWIVARFGACLAMFDHLAPSQETGVLKPHREAYAAVERLTGRPASEHLLIDDLEANVAGARAVGWDGIVHTTAEALELELRTRGLL
jgi:HAD superfamily hydrolase (TIGR01509 family)